MSEASLMIEAPPEGVSSRRGFVLHTLRHRPAAVIGATILVLVGLGAVLAPWIAPYALHEQVGPVFGHPSWSHPLGLDDGGIDMVARAARSSSGSPRRSSRWRSAARWA